MSTTSVAFLATLTSGSAGAAVGGPDAFGYTFADQADGAVYAYVDISATGVQVATGDDSLGAANLLGAPFTFYGANVTQLRASTNGFLTSTAGTSSDFGNDCPLPFAPTGGGFRIAPLHDDLVSTVYYQYFDEVQAAAIGYPGETAGISVYQWVGEYFPAGGPDAIDVEAILFHDDGTILTMVAQDSNGGSGATLGIQNADASTGLNYTCNTAGSTIPGVTAVEYALGGGGGPDSDCCTASPTATPGCTDPTCEATVCALDPFCCATEWDQVCADEAALECPALCGPLPPPPITINEIRIDNAGANDIEFIELAGPPGAPLDGLHYLVIGDTPTGVIESGVNLNGQVVPPSGYFVVAEAGFPGGANLTTVLNFENNDTVTHLLVAGFSGAVNDDIDANADGIPDVTPWDTVVDAVAIIDPDSTELPYGPGATCMAGPTCQELTMDPPGHVFRCADGTGPFNPGNFDLAVVPQSDSPGAPNPCACGDGVLLLGEECDDAGESATCDADCTAAACGDGTVNMTAGEACDDMGETAACNADCSVAACGDGIVNAAAGEDCDDGGESATCDADCTAVACGDGIVNATAGEDCDDGGESATCDADCTAAMCGDMVVNGTAGETCDDGGRSDTCNADCTSATCGDGILNMTAGEECDGDGMGVPGETDTCDADCTAAMCGDAVINATAGETCDDGGESKNCDDDCSVAECGDGAVNATAGEECDDGNTDDGDGCAADCTIEEEPGTTGGETSDTGLDDTAGESGGETGVTSGDPGPSTLSAGNESSGGGDTETETDSGSGSVVPSEEGCNCSTTGQGRSAAWSVLALFGLGALRRRRRRA